VAKIRAAVNNSGPFVVKRLLFVFWRSPSPFSGRSTF
jgi:hypothetical protein